jgi:hypothetical protein
MSFVKNIKIIKKMMMLPNNTTRSKQQPQKAISSNYARKWFDEFPIKKPKVTPNGIS